MVTCSFCGKFMGYQKNALKCRNQRCSHFCCGIAEAKIKQQAIKELLSVSKQMLKISENNLNVRATEVVETPEMVRAQENLKQLLTLQAQGMSHLEDAIQQARSDCDRFRPTDGADWQRFRELIRQPGLFKGVTDAELRPVFLECIEQILYVGNFREVEISFRDPA